MITLGRLPAGGADGGHLSCWSMPSPSPLSPALLTDRYELTMLAAALADGTADRDCVFEVFARRLPHGRRYGVLAGTGRLLDELAEFRFGDAEIDALRAQGIDDPRLLDHLAGFRFTGDVDGYAEGDVYFPGSPVLTVRASFGQGVLLETLALSILNHDSAIAAALTELGYHLPTYAEVSGVVPDGPSDGTLKPRDRFVQLDGKPVRNGAVAASPVTLMAPDRPWTIWS